MPAQPVFAIFGPGTEYTIDSITLRMTALDPAAMAAAAESMLADMETSPLSLESAAALSSAALMLAASGQPHRAEQLLPPLLSSQGGETRQQVRLQLRCVQVLQAVGRYPEAVSLARQALDLTLSDSEALPLQDFALHHLGKALFDAGDCVASQVALAQALRLRELKGDAMLLQSTRMALAVASGEK